MKIQTIRNTRYNYEFKLSTDKTRNLNFVLAKPEIYQELYGMMHSYLVGRNTGVILELEDEKNYDPRFMLVDEHLNYYDLLDLFVDMKHTEDFEQIADDANHTFTDMLSERNNYNCEGFLKVQDCQIMIPSSLSAAEAVLAYYSLLTSIRNRYKMNTPLIIEGLGRYALKYAPLVVQLVASTAPQAVVFMTEYNFTTPIQNDTANAQDSVYDMIRYNHLGFVYRLEDKVSEYEQQF